MLIVWLDYERQSGVGVVVHSVYGDNKDPEAAAAEVISGQQLSTTCSTS